MERPIKWEEYADLTEMAVQVKQAKDVFISLKTSPTASAAPVSWLGDQFRGNRCLTELLDIVFTHNPQLSALEAVEQVRRVANIRFFAAKSRRKATHEFCERMRLELLRRQLVADDYAVGIREETQRLVSALNTQIEYNEHSENAYRQIAEGIEQIVPLFDVQKVFARLSNGQPHSDSNNNEPTVHPQDIASTSSLSLSSIVARQNNDAGIGGGGGGSVDGGDGGNPAPKKPKHLHLSDKRVKRWLTAGTLGSKTGFESPNGAVESVATSNEQIINAPAIKTEFERSLSLSAPELIAANDLETSPSSELPKTSKWRAVALSKRRIQQVAPFVIDSVPESPENTPPATSAAEPPPPLPSSEPPPPLPSSEPPLIPLPPSEPVFQAGSSSSNSNPPANGIFSNSTSSINQQNVSQKQRKRPLREPAKSPESGECQSDSDSGSIDESSANVQSGEVRVVTATVLGKRAAKSAAKSNVVQVAPFKLCNISKRCQSSSISMSIAARKRAVVGIAASSFQKSSRSLESVSPKKQRGETHQHSSISQRLINLAAATTTSGEVDNRRSATPHSNHSHTSTRSRSRSSSVANKKRRRSGSSPRRSWSTCSSSSSGSNRRSKSRLGSATKSRMNRRSDSERSFEESPRQRRSRRSNSPSSRRSSGRSRSKTSRKESRSSTSPPHSRRNHRPTSRVTPFSVASENRHSKSPHFRPTTSRVTSAASHPRIRRRPTCSEDVLKPKRMITAKTSVSTLAFDSPTGYAILVDKGVKFSIVKDAELYNDSDPWNDWELNAAHEEYVDAKRTRTGDAGSDHDMEDILEAKRNLLTVAQRKRAVYFFDTLAWEEIHKRELGDDDGELVAEVKRLAFHLNEEIACEYDDCQDMKFAVFSALHKFCNIPKVLGFVDVPPPGGAAMVTADAQRVTGEYRAFLVPEKTDNNDTKTESEPKTLRELVEHGIDWIADESTTESGGEKPWVDDEVEEVRREATRLRDEWAVASEKGEATKELKDEGFRVKMRVFQLEFRKKAVHFFLEIVLKELSKRGIRPADYSQQIDERAKELEMALDAATSQLNFKKQIVFKVKENILQQEMINYFDVAAILKLDPLNESTALSTSNVKENGEYPCGDSGQAISLTENTADQRNSASQVQHGSLSLGQRPAENEKCPATISSLLQRENNRPFTLDNTKRCCNNLLQNRTISNAIDWIAEQTEDDGDAQSEPDWYDQELTLPLQRAEVLKMQWNKTSSERLKNAGVDAVRRFTELEFRKKAVHKFRALCRDEISRRGLIYEHFHSVVEEKASALDQRLNLSIASKPPNTLTITTKKMILREEAADYLDVATLLGLSQPPIVVGCNSKSPEQRSTSLNELGMSACLQSIEQTRASDQICDSFEQRPQAKSSTCARRIPIEAQSEINFAKGAANISVSDGAMLQPTTRTLPITPVAETNSGNVENRGESGSKIEGDVEFVQNGDGPAMNRGRDGRKGGGVADLCEWITGVPTTIVDGLDENNGHALTYDCNELLVARANWKGFALAVSALTSEDERSRTVASLTIKEKGCQLLFDYEIIRMRKMVVAKCSDLAQRSTTTMTTLQLETVLEQLDKSVESKFATVQRSDLFENRPEGFTSFRVNLQRLINEVLQEPLFSGLVAAINSR